MAADVEELIILADTIERLLLVDTVEANRSQIQEAVACIEQRAPDGSICALASHVAMALGQRSLDGPHGGIAAHRALCAVDRLRLALQNMRGEQAGTDRLPVDLRAL